MNEDLIRFLRTSQLGPLVIGGSTGDIEKLLGTALSRSDVEGGVVIWRYGPLEVSIERELIVGLQLSCLKPLDRLPPALDGLNLPSADTEVGDFIEMLESRGIGWEIDRQYTFDRQLSLRTEGGARVFFDLDRRELQSIAANDPRPDREVVVREESQINLEISEDKDGGVVAYVRLPEHPGQAPGVVKRNLKLGEVMGDYLGRDVFLDFDENNVLIGIEILG